jgi:acyl-homoserine-lactone acylase
VRSRTVTVHYKHGAGMARKSFTVYSTQHGPVVRRLGDRWVSVSLMRRPITALIQSYSRTKAPNLAAFRKLMELHSNASNNTLFADSAGNIAYLHSNYIPRRDTSFDWTAPVDGSNPATAYRGVLSFDESPNVLNPTNGWVYNSNNWPWSAAGAHSPKREAFPRYVETGVEETPRGTHALRVLGAAKRVTMRSLTAAAFDSWLPAFDRLLPPLLAAYEKVPVRDAARARLREQVTLLRGWNHRWGATSPATTLAVWWGQVVTQRVAAEALAAHVSAQTYVATRATPDELLGSLAAASDSLTATFGSWKQPWGEVNRFQRFNDDILSRFDDAQPSIPVPFTSGIWGSLASFGAPPSPGNRKRYGTSGNSFVAVVEFGDSVRARAVTAGGESGHPDSPHFQDQAERYASGNLRKVYFYPAQLKGHTEREYHPGE